ncbi:sialidase [Streptomyces sp. G44]|uniref:RCC1 domain-containing protein n=1 Tax=Streptomyces sp. G44 TaxID=2807632 RepID=UPI0019617621|nr:sialidase [Streptomyces sp. G44]MBM7168820.1 sialidase [Streptomyces sp. G44]
MNAKTRGLRLRAALTVIAAATTLGVVASPAHPAEGNDPLVYAWGANWGGQMGNSTDNDRYAPAPIPSLPKRDVFEIAAGGGVSDGWGFGVALRNDGSVWTWGQNDKGQLGTGPTKPDHNSALGKVPKLNGIVDVAAGGQHALALRVNSGKADGVYAWGLNDKGQVGDHTNDDRSVPQLVQSMHGGKQVAAGCNHSMLLTDKNTVRTWGLNDKGQLGTGPVGKTEKPDERTDEAGEDHNTPVEVPGLTDVVKIAAGCEYSLAMKSDGTVWAWGDNTKGQLGINKDGDAVELSNRPVQVQGLPEAQGAQPNSPGEPGETQTGTGTGTGTDATEGTGPLARDIVAGYDHAYVLYSDDKVYGWGNNEDGQLADGTKTNRTSAHEAIELPSVQSISAGRGYGLAVRTAGGGTSNDIIGWGLNNHGQLGSGDALSHDLNDNDQFIRVFPQEAETNNPFTRVTAGNSQSSYAY